MAKKKNREIRVQTENKNEEMHLKNIEDTPTIIGNKHIVKDGENIENIADKYGVYWKTLYAKNKFVIGNDPNKLEEGMVLDLD